MPRLHQLLVCSNDGADDFPQAESSGPPHVFVVEEVRRMRGGSQSHLMRCRGDDYHVVKFQGNPQGTRILANELLGTLLAARMGLPTIPVAVCYVSEELIRLTPDLCFQIARGRIPCQPGMQFGSRYPRDPRNAKVMGDLLPDYELARVKNAADFAGMLVFDKWTCNTDKRQTLFLQNRDGAYETVMIDQGMCFNGSEWNFPDAPLRGFFCRYAVYKSVSGMDDFERWLAMLESDINEEVLIETAKGIPPEWYDSEQDSLQRLVEQLDRRRSKVRDLLWETRKARPYAFPNWIERTISVVSTISHERKEATATNNKIEIGHSDLRRRNKG